MRVLVTGAGALLGQGVIRSLLASSLDVEIAAVDPSPLAAGLYWAQRSRLVPMATEPNYLEHMDALLGEERPDVVLIGTDVELPLFAEHREELEHRHNTRIVVSDPQAVRIAGDKYETFQFMRQHGFWAPDSCLPGAEQELIERVGFPLVVKPRAGARSIGVHIAHDRAELEHAVRVVRDPVIQQLVGTEADEFTAGVLCFDGHCHASIVMRRDLRDGNTYRAFVEPYPELNAVVRAMGEKLAPYGPANFQFRLSEGEVKVFEINARFSGTTPIRMLAGFNEVEAVLRHVVYGEPISQPELLPLTILRHWSETIVGPDELLSTP
ncbi:MAG: ATP-grasp domain-containing protein [Acidimicrobiia bacterium]